MASNEFTLEVLSPAKQYTRATVSEVVLPAFDGEIGVLANHEDFIGLLGTGPLKYVSHGNDHWLLVSSGIFTIKDGELSIVAEVVEEASDIRVDETKRRLQELEPAVSSKSSYSAEHQKLTTEYDRLKARLEVFRRTNVVN
jgi:F-type H+-transporting ATPase subunit epsilon